MIPKIICFIFGHKRVGKFFVKETEDGDSLWTQRLLPICPRCGKKLNNLDQYKKEVIK